MVAYRVGATVAVRRPVTDAEQHDAACDRRLDRRSFLAGGLRVGGAIAAGGLAAEALAAASTRATPRRVGPYRRSRQPNILVIMVDQLRQPRWFGAGAGAAMLSSAVERLARAGVAFTRHYAVSNDCTPARGALLTGLYSHQTGCMITGRSTLDPAFPTWGTMLRQHGYGTWWFGKWHLSRGDRHWRGHGGRRALERYGFDGGTFPSPNGAPGQGWRVDPHIAAQFEGWLARSGTAAPWCTTVSFVNPHDIAWWWRWSRRTAAEAAAPAAVGALPVNFETPAQLMAQRKPRVQLSLQETSALSFGAVPFDGPGVLAGWLPFLDLYVKLQREVDGQIQRVLAALASRPRVLENTVVLFVSDHGEYCGSHGLRGKGAGMYEEAIRVPLILADFTGRLGLRPGVRDQLTASVDVAPLLLTIAAGSDDWRLDPTYAQISSRADLLAIARNASLPGRDHVLHATDEVVTEYALQPYAADAPLHVAGIITPSYKYATYTNWRSGTTEALPSDQDAELYDYATVGGRLEVENLAGRTDRETHAHAALERAIRDELHEPLPLFLAGAQARGIAEYHHLAIAERTQSELHRLRVVERIVRDIERHERLPGPPPL